VSRKRALRSQLAEREFTDDSQRAGSTVTARRGRSSERTNLLVGRSSSPVAEAVLKKLEGSFGSLKTDSTSSIRDRTESARKPRRRSPSPRRRWQKPWLESSLQQGREYGSSAANELFGVAGAGDRLDRRPWGLKEGRRLV